MTIEVEPEIARERASSVRSQFLTTSVASSLQLDSPETSTPRLPVRISAASLRAGLASKEVKPQEVRSTTRRHGRRRPRGSKEGGGGDGEEDDRESPVQRAATRCFREPEVELSTGSRERSLGLSLRSRRSSDVSEERSSIWFFCLRGRRKGKRRSSVSCLAAADDDDDDKKHCHLLFSLFLSLCSV